MNLTIFNGSPRGKRSNTAVLLEHFTNGFMTDSNNHFEIAYLNRTKDVNKNVELFEKSEHVILAFPLYMDVMPAVVKTFIEALEPLCRREGDLSIGFIVQGGFPEPIHSRYVEKYLAKLANRLGRKYTGTVIKGGVEAVKFMPAWLSKKRFRPFYQLGVDYGTTAKFNEKIIRKLAPKDKLPKPRLLMFKLMRKTGLPNFYWDNQLKTNNAFEKRFDKPYIR